MNVSFDARMSETVIDDKSLTRAPKRSMIPSKSPRAYISFRGLASCRSAVPFTYVLAWTTSSPQKISAIPMR